MQIFGIGTDSTPPPVERRDPKFTERISMYMVVVATIGAFLILLDPKFTLTIGGQVIAMGGEGFSQELKGAVVTIMLLGGWTSVQKFWLDTTDTAKIQSQSIARIAEASPVDTVAAMAANTEATMANTASNTRATTANTVATDANTAATEAKS